MPPRQKRAGLSLLETAALVSLSAIVLAALVPTFVRKLRLSKVAEATGELAELQRRASAYYSRYHRMPGGQRERGCVPGPAGPAPARPSEEPVEADFTAEDTPGHATWEALGYTPDGAIRYRYSLVTSHAGCAPREPEPEVLMTLRAEGDLDGDGVLSTLERDSGPDGEELVPVGVLRATRRIE